MIVLQILLVVAFAYFLGSIPVGVLIGKWLKGIDVRQLGSGKIGAANVQRALGWKAGGLVLVLDAVKSGLAVFIAGLVLTGGIVYMGDVGHEVRLVQVLAALAAMAGHNWPIYLKFKGGRGVVTFFGGLLAMSPLAAIFGIEIFVVTTALSKYVSLGSILGATATYVILLPLVLWDNNPVELLLFCVVGTLLILYQHRDNIYRLQMGRERRIGEGVGAA